jgi:hypothetical protein
MKISINGSIPVDSLSEVLDRSITHLLGNEEAPDHISVSDVVLSFILVDPKTPKSKLYFEYAGVGYEPDLVLNVLEVTTQTVKEKEDKEVSSVDDEIKTELVEFLPEHKKSITSLPDWVYEDGLKGVPVRFGIYDWYRLKTITMHETYKRVDDDSIPRADAKFSMQMLVEEGLNLALEKRGLKPLRGRDYVATKSIEN